MSKHMSGNKGNSSLGRYHLPGSGVNGLRGFITKVLQTNWLSSYCCPDGSSAVSHLLAWLPEKQMKRRAPSKTTEIQHKGHNALEVGASDRGHASTLLPALNSGGGWEEASPDGERSPR